MKKDKGFLFMKKSVVGEQNRVFLHISVSS